MKSKILIFEDEPAIAEAVVYALETDGFSACRAATAGEGLKLFASEKFDLVILDVGLPDENGFEVCKKIRKQSEVPVFFLTARGEEVDRIVGLEIGADDYITKPFSPRELTARVKALFRRVKGQLQPEQARSLGPFTIDELKYAIAFNGTPLVLTRYEFGLLRTLLRRPGQVFSRDQLMDEIWDEPEMALDRTVDTHIKSLRGKLREIAPGDEWIVTHRGIGYSLKEFAR